MNPKNWKGGKENNRSGLMRNWLQHNLNCLHVYCRLVRIMPRWLARKIVLYWEKTAIYGLIYAGM